MQKSTVGSVAMDGRSISSVFVSSSTAGSEKYFSLSENTALPLNHMVKTVMAYATAKNSLASGRTPGP